MAKASKKRAAKGGREQASGPTVGLVAIVRDEEEMLPRCLASIKGIVDEMIIVDTGSTDKTKEIAESYGAKVVDFEWIDDFSAARNFGLDHSTADWVLQLDADEELISSRRDVRRALKGTSRHGIQVNLLVGPDMETVAETPGHRASPVRLFRRADNIRFKYAIHEAPTLKPEDIGSSGLTILHFGPHLDDEESRAARFDRNIRLLRGTLEESPADLHLLVHLGNEYFILEEWLSASEQYLLVEEIIGGLQDPRSPIVGARRNLVVCLYRLGQPGHAITLLKKLQHQYPKFTDLFFVEAQICASEGNIDGGIQLLNKCKQMGEPALAYPSWGGTGTWQAQQLLDQMAADS